MKTNIFDKQPVNQWHQSRYFTLFNTISLSALLTFQGLAFAGTWIPLRNQPIFLQGGATSQLLLTNGNVVVMTWVDRLM